MIYALGSLQSWDSKAVHNLAEYADIEEQWRKFYQKTATTMILDGDTSSIESLICNFLFILIFAFLASLWTFFTVGAGDCL